MIKSYAKYIKDKLNDEDEDGILDEPIHFKHTKKLDEASKPKYEDLHDWAYRNDNEHLSKQGDDDEISGDYYRK